MNSTTANTKQASAKQAARSSRVTIPKQTTRTKVTTATASTKAAKQTLSKFATTVKHLQHPPQQHLQPTTVLPIINAPTSLTNLAQLSGITFLPISSTDVAISPSLQNPVSSINRATTNISHQTSPNFVTTTSINTNSGSNSKQQYQKPFVNRVPHAIRTTTLNQQHAYDLASIPSIHLINQTSGVGASSDSLSWRSNINVNPKNSARGQVSQPSQLTAAKSNGRGTAGGGSKGKTQCNTITNINLTANKTKTNNKNHKSNYTPVIQMNDSLPMLSLANSDLLSTSAQSCGESYEDVMVSPPSLDPLDEQHVDINGDMNNISLIKLMAILNNPALTITAVNSKTTNNQSSHSGFSSMNTDHLQSTSSTNFLDNSQPYISTPKSVDYLYANPQAALQNQSAESLRNRLPQSAANIKMIHNDVIGDISPIAKRNLSSSLTTGPQKGNNVYLNNLNMNEPKQSDPQLGWLSAAAATGTSQDNDFTINCGQTSTLSWSKGPINSNLREDASSPLNSRLNDPTMLSTSVRNLMMQQLPAGSSKQPTVSIQLLKHIDDQSKDNNSWPASTNPSQKSIFEPECILSVPQRTVQLLNQTAKRLESSKTVTSSCIKKKQPKKPFETTSKSRLYIPRSTDEQEEELPAADTTEPETYCGLNTINIVGSEEREVTLSERHHMLDVMMSDDNSLHKGNRLPEPDDIFINRSKRVMSKIDTMVERKRRKRFQRIRDRNPSWKTKKVEEMLVESDEEWSSDENVDLDKIGFITTHLPLEESETEQKKDFLNSVGLVSRVQRNKLAVQDCEKKSKLVSPLCLENPNEVSYDIRRFVDIMLKTGGENIQLRVDSNIKRNDLPLIEGLNRNSSRTKMNFMNALGLEKRSKRTTLYKVKSSLENSHIALPKQVDLIKVKSVVTSDKQQQPAQVNQVQPPKLVSEQTSKVVVLDHQPHGIINSTTTSLVPKMTFSTSCREALTPPTKNEYMKSLGLMAS